jgi:hypothetical protein
MRTAITKKNPDIYSKLLKRHMKLKAIYANCKELHYAKENKQPEPHPQKASAAMILAPVAARGLIVEVMWTSSFIIRNRSTRLEMDLKRATYGQNKIIFFR